MEGDKRWGSVGNGLNYQSCIDARSSVMAMLVCKGHDRIDVEDAIQEALVRIFVRYGTTGLIRRPSALLYAVTYRLLVDGLRYDARHPETSLCDAQLLASESDDDRSNSMLNSQSTAVLALSVHECKAIVAHLPIAEQWILQQCAFVGMTFEQCASLLDHKPSGPTLWRLYEEAVELAQYVYGLQHFGHHDLAEIELRSASHATGRGREEIRAAYESGRLRLGHWEITAPAA